MNDSQDTLALDQLVRTFRRRWWLIALPVLAGALIGALLAVGSGERYQATGTVLIGSTPSARRDADLTAEAVARLVLTRSVAEKVSRELADGRSPEELLAMVAARADDSGTYVEVTARDDDPVGAERLANSFVGQVSGAQSESLDELEAAVAATEERLRRAPGGSPAYDRLRAQLIDLRTTAVLRRVDAQVIDPAVSGASQGGGAPIRSGLIGAGLGLLFGLVVAFTTEALDPRVRSLRQLRNLTGAPQLAAMPRPRARRGRDAAAVLAANRQPFEHLRGALLGLHGGRRLRRILVMSPNSADEGKTFVVAGLATSLARLGITVCAVDGDLRRAELASHFGLRDAAKGLADTLRGAPLADAVQRVGLEEDPSAAAGVASQVHVLPAGSAGASSADLLAGQRMRELLDELGRQHEVVILDCPPILANGDALPLLEEASGVILVVRHSRTPRRAVERADRVVREARGALLGIVTTGVPRQELAAEGHGPWPSPAPAAVPDL